MPIIGNLIIRTGLDLGPLTRGLAEGETALEKFEKASQSTSSGGGGGGGAGPAGPDAGDFQGALLASMAPLASIGNKISAQFNAVGGTITTLARRIDGAMKAPAMNRALDTLQAKLRGGVAAAAAKAAGDLSLAERATLRLGPAADRALTAYRKFSAIRGFFAGLGDVAGKGLDRVSKLNLDGTARGAGLINSQFRTLAPTVGRATTAVKGLGFQIAAAFGVVGVVFKGAQLLKDFFVGGIGGASQFNETLSRTNVIFGDSAGKIIDQADVMAAKFGTSKDEYITAATSFGSVFKGLGKSQEEAAGLGNQLAQLGIDMASFDNSSNSEVFTALQAALRGEFDPLERYRVFLSAAKIEQEAMRLGLVKSKKDLDDNAKKQATLSLILKGSKDAQGDLARTQGEAANQFRKAGGGLQNFATSVGQILLPAVKIGTVAFNELLASLIETFESNRAMIEGWGASFAGIMETVGFAARNFGDIWELAQIGIQEKLINIVEYFETIPANLAIIGEYIANNWTNLIIDAVNAVASVFMNLGTNLGKLWEGIQSFASGKGFNVEFTPLLDGFEATAEKLPELLKPHLTSLDNERQAVFDRIGEREIAHEKAKAGAAVPAKAAEEANEAVAKAAEYHATAAVEFGSAEAGSALARFRNGGTGDDKPIKDVAKTAKQQLDESRRQTAALDKIAAGQGGAALQTFALGT